MELPHLAATSGRGLAQRQWSTYWSRSSPSRSVCPQATLCQLSLLTILAKPHPSSLNIQPRALQPLMVVPREHLPLSSIDLASPHGEFPQSRLFESHIKILDLESRVATAPSVLIARNETKGTAYAVERQDNGLYVVCKLGAWVDLHSLAEQATVLLRQRLEGPKAAPREQEASTALATPLMYKNEKKKRAAIEAIQFLVRKRARSQSVSNFEDAVRREDAANQPPIDAQLPSADTHNSAEEENRSVETPASAESRLPAVQDQEAVPQQTAQSIFDNIRTQYFEVLYRSKVTITFRS